MVSLSLELRTPPLAGFGRRTVDPSAKQRLRQASEQSKALVFCLSNFTTAIKDEGEAHDDDDNDENDDDDNDER